MEKEKELTNSQKFDKMNELIDENGNITDADGYFEIQKDLQMELGVDEHSEKIENLEDKVKELEKLIANHVHIDGKVAKLL